MRKQKALSWSAVLITVALVAGVFWTEPGPRLVEREASPLAVVVSELRSHDVQPQRTLTGRFKPVKTSELKFEVAGRIAARYVETGAAVAAGQVLLALDDRDYRDALTKAQADFDLVAAEVERDRQLLRLAESNSQLQQQEVARLDALMKNDLASRSQLDEARRMLVGLKTEQARAGHSVAAAEARLNLVRSQRDRAARNLERTRLTAPFDGVVNRIEAEVGGYANAGQSALTVVDVARFDLLLHVGGETASVLEVGQGLEIEVPPLGASGGEAGDEPARTIEGELVSLQVAPDPRTFTYEARVRTDADGLRAGMTARARLPQPLRDDVITVPIAAVQYLDGRTYVFVEYDGALKRTRVMLGARIGAGVIVREGLEPGLRVVVHDVDRLSDGQKVVVRRGVEPIN